MLHLIAGKFCADARAGGRSDGWGKSFRGFIVGRREGAGSSNCVNLHRRLNRLLNHCRASNSRLDAPTDPPNPTDAERLQSGYRYALSLAHHAEDAEDLVQGAWLNLCRRYGSVTSNAVLFTAIRNLFVDLCRRRKIVHFESLDQPVPPQIPGVPGEEPGLKGDLEALLAVLRPVEREVIFLHYYEGRTAEEIGAITGQPRGTVLSLLHRSIGKLREAAARPASTPRCNQWLLPFVTLG